MTTFSDDFNRADGAPGANWVLVSGIWTIVSQQLSSGTTGTGLVLRAATAMATNDNSAQITIATTAVASHGIWCRGNAGITQGYLWRNDGTSWALFSVVGGSFTSIGTFAAAAVSGDVVKIQAVGSTITGFVNGVARVTVTNTAVTTGTSVGVRSDGVSALRFDDFTGADVTSGTTATAGLAAVAVAAPQASASVAAQPSTAAVAGTALGVAPAVAAQPATAAVAVTALGAVPGVTAQPATAAVAVAARAPVAAPAALPGTAAVTVTAYQAVPGLAAAPGPAAVAVTAYPATVTGSSSTTATAGLAQVSVAAYGAVPGAGALPGTAHVAGTAYAPGAAIVVVAGSAALGTTAYGVRNQVQPSTDVTLISGREPGNRIGGREPGSAVSGREPATQV